MILSIDPSSSRCGYAVMREDETLIEAGLFTPRRSEDPANARIRSMALDLRETLNEYRPESIVIEDTGSHMHAARGGGGASLLDALAQVLGDSDVCNADTELSELAAHIADALTPTHQPERVEGPTVLRAGEGPGQSGLKLQDPFVADTAAMMADLMNSTPGGEITLTQSQKDREVVKALVKLLERSRIRREIREVRDSISIRYGSFIL